MNDEHLISRLRAANPADTDPTAADVTAAATRGRRLRHRRHALAGAGAAGALSLAILVTIALPGGGTPVLQEAAPPAVGADAGPGDTGRPAPEKYRILLEALGVAPNEVGDWGMRASVNEGLSLGLDPDSPSAKGLPTGVAARIEIGAKSKPGRAPLDCPPPGHTINGCELRLNGSLRIVRGIESMPVETTEAEHGKAYTTNYLTYVREDGVEVSIRLIVLSPRKVETVERRDRAQAWMAELDDELATAAIDPRLDADPQPTAEPANSGLTPGIQAEPAKEANLKELQRQLGDEWLVQYAGFGGMRAIGVTRKERWTGWNVHASVDAGVGDVCGPGSTNGLVYGDCVQRTLPDGRTVHLRRGARPSSGEPAATVAVALRVAYTQPDGTVVIAILSLAREATDIDSARMKASATWADEFEDELIAAATSGKFQRDVPVD